MSDVFKTVLSGTAVAVLGLIAKEAIGFYFFERMKRFSDIRGRVAERIIFWADVYSNGESTKVDLWEAASKDLRESAAELFSFGHERHLLLFWLPGKQKLQDAASALIGLSNSRTLDPLGTKTYRSRIEKFLHLETAR